MIRIEQRIIGEATIKICKGRYELSIHVDDSCAGTIPTTMFRSDLRVYCTERKENDKIIYNDITKQFVSNYDEYTPILADFDAIKEVMDLIEKRVTKENK